MKKSIQYKRYNIIITTLLLWLITNTIVAKEKPMPIAPELHVETIRPAQGLPTDILFYIYQDKEDFMWFGTAEGLCRWDGYQMKVYKSNYNIPDLLPHNWINCILEDQNHNLWIGTQFGLAIMDKTTGIIRHINQDTPQSINCLLETSTGEIWQGTGTGIDRITLKDGQFQSRKLDLGVSHNGIKTIVEDSSGDVWIGTWNGGLLRYQTEKEQIQPYPPLNEENIVTAILEVKQNNLWIGTWNHGLYRFENPHDPLNCSYKKCTQHEKKESSLLHNRIFSLSQDDNNEHIWVGTYQGLYLLTEPDNPESFIRKASCKNSFGELFFGGNNGISYFNPEMIKENNYQPSLVFTHFRIYVTCIEELLGEIRKKFGSINMLVHVGANLIPCQYTKNKVIQYENKRRIQRTAGHHITWQHCQHTGK